MTEAELAIGAPPPREENSVGAIARRRWEAWKAGDVGVMPVVIGLIIIVAFFYSQNSNYLAAGNFTNLMVQMAGVTTIAIGVVFVLLLGEIDLSIGYVSGIAGVVVAKLQLPDGSWEVQGLAAIVIAVIVTALIGLFQGSFVAIIGVPSFVVTLAGLLFWQGVILYAIPRTSVIGAIYLAAYLGGAVASHYRLGNPLATHVLFPVYVAAFLWGGLALRSPRLLAVLMGGK